MRVRFKSNHFDALQIVQLKLVPRMLIGHSFGGKVALSMVEQAKKPLAQPVQVGAEDTFCCSVVQRFGSTLEAYARTTLGKIVLR